MKAVDQGKSNKLKNVKTKKKIKNKTFKNGDTKPNLVSEGIKTESKIKKKKLKHVKTKLNGTSESTNKLKDNDAVTKKKKNKTKQKSEKETKLKGQKKSSKKQPTSHRDQLESLKEIDPEFYNFLKQNDKELLEFNWDDSDDDTVDENPEKDSISDEENKFHKPSGKLEVASDESDFAESDDEQLDEDNSDEDDDNSTALNVVTLKLLRKWQTNLESTHPSIETIRNTMQAFSSALSSISDQTSKVANFKVEGASTFNGVIQLCVLHLQQAIYKFLGINSKSKTPIHKTKKWTKIRGGLRYYLVDMTRLIEHVSSSHILTVLLKHLHQMSSMLASFPTISKPILKRLIVLWSSSNEEAVRVLSFLCILKITRNLQHSLLNHVLKAMYLSYVRNSKFVSPNTLPSINFMRRSLIEMFALDLNVAYQHAFLYIRQLAIHLRNAIILKKKESFQSVYNWQFINSIKLWAELLGNTANSQQLKPLVYPLVSIITGVIKLIPTAQFFPLRFHCLQALISIAKQTNTFIPVLPFILEVLNSNTFNKKHSIVSMKPLQFTCILRLNKSQMSENGFRDEVIEQIFGLMLEYLSHESASLAFPDLVVPAVMALKQYLKICKNPNYSRKLKQMLDKISENSNHIENQRKRINFGLKDFQLIQAWETRVRNDRTPLSIYYDSWVKTHQIKKKRQAANTDDINDYDIPMIKRKKLEAKKENEGETELFPSDDDDEEIDLNLKNNDEVEDEVIQKVDEKKKNKKLKKKLSSKVKQNGVNQINEEHDDEFEDDCVDIVKDLDINDW